MIKAIITQRKWHTQQYGRLGWTCKEILYFAYGGCGRENRHSHWHKLYL